MPHLAPQRRPKNTNTTYLWVEGFFVAQARRLATKLNRRYVASLVAPIGHISMLGAKRVAGLWADAKQIAKASKYVDPGADSVADGSMPCLWFSLQS